MSEPTSYQRLPEMLSIKHFNQYTLDWQMYFSVETQPLKDYFEIDYLKTNYVIFTKQCIHKLLSTSGVTKVKAKFALYPLKDGKKIFSIVLFGTDDQEVHTSAYYLGTPSNLDPSLTLGYTPGSDQNGYVPNDLANRWLENWRLIKKDEIIEKLFDTNFGYLNGYSYEMRDFMDSLYPSGQINDEGLNMYFALHDHHYPGCTDPFEMNYTFGMVLQGFPFTLDGSSPANDGDDPGDQNLYYDLSLPSPPAT